MKSSKQRKVEATIKDWIERYPSVRKWFLKSNGEKRFVFKTEKRNLECLEFWCNSLNKNPDELVPSNLKEGKANERRILAKLLENSSLVTETVVLQHLTKYHTFCKHNGLKFPYGGDQIRNIWRLKKWTPEEVEKLTSLFGKINQKK